MIELKDKLRAMIFCSMCEKKITAQIETLRKERAQPALPQPVYQPFQNSIPYKTNPRRLVKTNSEAIKSGGFFITQYIILAVTALLFLAGAVIGVFKIYEHFPPIYAFLASCILFACSFVFKYWFLYLNMLVSKSKAAQKSITNNTLYRQNQKQIDLMNAKIQAQNTEIAFKNAAIDQQNQQKKRNFQQQYNNQVSVIDQKIALLERNRTQAHNTLERIRRDLNMDPQYAGNEKDLLSMYSQVKYANSYGNNFGKLQTDYRNHIKPEMEKLNYLRAINNISTQISQRLDEFNGYINKLNSITENGFKTTSAELADLQNFFNNRFSSLDTEIDNLHKSINSRF